MNLIYSCVFYNKEYIKVVELLLKSYSMAVKDMSKYTYLIITEPTFKDNIEKICKNLKINYDIWCVNIKNENLTRNPLTHLDNCFQACYSRFYISDYPKINNFKKILYLDCDLLIANDLSPIFDLKLENLLYVVHEPIHRNNHCFFFSNDEFNNLDKSKTFTTAILLFNNNDFMHNIIKTNLRMMKEFQSKNSRIAPPCFDQPVTNKICIDNNMSNNSILSEYCLNVMGSDTIDKINQINSYIICHFATSVGHSESKLLRMRYSLEKIML